MFRRRQKASDDPLSAVDPHLVPPRFAPRVADALHARRQFADLVDGLNPGPVRDRLSLLLDKVDAGVLEVWGTAQRSAELERVLASLDPERVTKDYKAAKRSSIGGELMAAQEQRFQSVQRLLNALDDTDERLRLLDARLGGVVARAAEVALAAGTGADDLDAELADVVAELGAVHAGLEALR